MERAIEMLIFSSESLLLETVEDLGGKENKDLAREWFPFPPPPARIFPFFWFPEKPERENEEEGDSPNVVTKGEANAEEIDWDWEEEVEEVVRREDDFIGIERGKEEGMICRFFKDGGETSTSVTLESWEMKFIDPSASEDRSTIPSCPFVPTSLGGESKTILTPPPTSFLISSSSWASPE